MAPKRDIEGERRQFAASVEAAKARIETQSSKAIRQVRVNAERKAAAELVEACDAELALRGTHDFTAEEAAAAIEVAQGLDDDKPLQERIVAAFTAVPPSDEERDLVRIIGAHPGASYASIHKEYPRKDAALVAGHLIYDRFGYFRSVAGSEGDRSALLLIKAAKGRQVTWQFTPEAQGAFTSLGMLEQLSA